MELTIDRVKGLGEIEAAQLEQLVQVFNAHQVSNARKERYYAGAISLGEVNLGIALPEGISNLRVGCEWGRKAVDVLAARSMFDGFVSSAGTELKDLNRILEKNNFYSQYDKAVKDELKLGPVFATLSADLEAGCKIRFHSARTAAALWDGERQRIECGMAIIDAVPDETEALAWTPSHINFYTDSAIWELLYTGGIWQAVEKPHRMGQPLMVALVWNPDSDKPFGSSRINYPVRALIDGYVRTIANAAIALEFDTTPQKYLLGITDDQYDAVVSSKFKQYVGSIIAATQNPETGENPVFGQLQQGSLTPHVEMIRILATQFSAATGLTVTDTGVVNDANPTSSDAILAQSQTLVLLAEQLNKSNGAALVLIAQMALAIAKRTNLDGLEAAETDIVPYFKNPAMPSVSVTADAAIKIAGAREGFATTDTFLEMIGFSQADIRRIKAQESRARGMKLLEAEMTGPEPVEQTEETNANIEE